MNASLAEYHVTVNLDVPSVEIIYTDIPDEHAFLGVDDICDHECDLQRDGQGHPRPADHAR